MLEKLIDQKILQPIDLFFSQMQDPKTEDEKIFFATLMAVSRAGNICLNIDSWYCSDVSLSVEWKDHVRKGSKTFAPTPYVCQDEGLFYLERNFYYENEILFHLKRLFQPIAEIPLAIEGLTLEQAHAAKLALSSSLSIIEGGPGTGKTFLINSLVRSMGKEAKVILAAPTGKATARLRNFNPGIYCATLHSLLGIDLKRTMVHKKQYLLADMIIIDECSMMDIRLFVYVLSAISVGQRIVFLGDCHQLPPIEGGAIFHDLNDLIPTAHLTQCLRSDKKEVLETAHSILKGTCPSISSPLSLEWILHQVDQYYSYLNTENLDTLNSHFDDFCILSPLREGVFGVHNLNQIIYQHFVTHIKEDSIFAVPILMNETNYELELYNGEMGYLLRSKDVLYKVYFPASNRVLLPSILPSYELAYVMSVHKSQGSEFQKVLLVVAPGSEVFGREVLYTGATRAKIELLLCADSDNLAKTIQHTQQRKSGIKARLKR